MSDSRPLVPGQAAAALPLLRTYRDLLTEQFLGGAAMERLLGMAALDFAPRRDASGHGLVGFGIAAPEGFPRLVLFAERSTDAAGELESRLEMGKVPVELVTGVRFEAAGPRPVPGGGSIGHGIPGGDSGTLGCVVRRRQGGGDYGLTCNHVILDRTQAIPPDEVWAPGATQGGRGADRLGRVHDFAPIDFTGLSNVIDAALAEPDSPADLDPAIAGIGRVAGLNLAPVFGDRVQKSGASTRHTTGRYWYQINAQIAYAGGATALFRDMLGIVGTAGPFANQGDSGALVLDDSRRAVGMLISVATGINLSLATAIKPVLDHFDVDIV